MTITQIKAFVLTAGILLCITPLRAAVFFTGSDKEVIQVEADKNTGLDAIYVVYDTSGVTMHYTSSAQVTWHRYSNLGGGYAEEISDVSRDGNDWSIPLESDMGYIIDDGGKRLCYWVTDYKNHMLRIDNITPAPEQQCEGTVLEIEGTGDPIHYFTVNGQQRTLDRKIRITYDNQVWDSEALQFERQEIVKTLESLTPVCYITPAIYCSTYFHISGDRFLDAWDMIQEAESGSFSPIAVDVYTEAIQDVNDDPDYKSNQMAMGTEGLGGSAPAEISFRAYCTDGVMHDEWQMADDPDFENITYRITQRDLDYTFTQEGTVYIRYVGSNSDGSCEQYGDVYTVTIGASELKCPNAFSPGASEGVNDEWKVSYRSIIDFECWIFDRYGNEIFHFTDPEQGWDGKREGKLVKPGVYYYVIQAKGADGKSYKKSGDINILRYSTYGSGSAVEQ